MDKQFIRNKSHELDGIHPKGLQEFKNQVDELVTIAHNILLILSIV